MLNNFNHITSNYPLLLLLPVCVDPIHNTILTLSSLYLMCFNDFYPRGQKKDAYIARVSLSLTQKFFLANLIRQRKDVLMGRLGGKFTDGSKTAKVTNLEKTRAWDAIYSEAVANGLPIPNIYYLRHVILSYISKSIEDLV